MTAYQIAENPVFNSREVSFDQKPAKAIITALKGLKMRWNPKKSIWYGFASESAILDAILGADVEEQDAPVVTTDGYMGGGAICGAKSYKWNNSDELKKKIRADFKEAGINFVTIRQERGGWTTSLCFSIKLPVDALFTKEEFTQAYQYDWSNHYDEFNGDWNSEEARLWQAERVWNRIVTNGIQNTYGLQVHKAVLHCAKDKELSQIIKPEYAAKLEKMASIVANYNYDNSNSMVDYFDVGFYEHYTIYAK